MISQSLPVEKDLDLDVVNGRCGSLIIVPRKKTAPREQGRQNVHVRFARSGDVSSRPRRSGHSTVTSASTNRRHRPTSVHATSDGDHASGRDANDVLPSDDRHANGDRANDRDGPSGVRRGSDGRENRDGRGSDDRRRDVCRSGDRRRDGLRVSLRR